MTTSNEASPIIDFPSEEDFSYRLLTGHNRTDGHYKTGDQLRTEYVQRTDELIRKITDGVDVTNRETGEREHLNPDYVVWLEKSARPVSWLVKELWPKLAPEPGKEAPEMPAFRYVNIDREQWVNTVDPLGVGQVNIDRVDPTIIRSLRSIFVSPQHKKHGLTEEIDTAPTELDGKTILIVDEVYSSGRTLRIAENFFEKAFPTAKVAGAYWMSGTVQKGMAVGNADLPVWYKEKDPTGRGVDNRNEARSQLSASLTQQLGGWFLSVGFKGMDPNSTQLRKEITHLAHDPNVLVMPSNQRDDLAERAEAANGISLAEYMQRKRELNAQTR
jgi:hypothetical protein